MWSANISSTVVKILIVEDQPVTRRALMSLVSAGGYCTRGAKSAEEALKLVREGFKPKVALVDLDLPGMSGIELIQQLDRVLPGVQAVLLTAASEETIENARKRRPIPYMRKPINIVHLMALLKKSVAA